MNVQKLMLKWADANKKIIPPYSAPQYSDFVCHIMRLFDERYRGKQCECGWVAPYGVVIEAGCALHDTPRTERR